MNETIRSIGEIFGIIATIESLFLFVSLKRERIILAKLFGDILWTVNYICFGMTTGAFLNIIAVFRECVFVQRGKNKFWDSYIWLYIFLGITIASIPITWNGYISIIPAIGSSCAVIGYFSKKPLHIRLFGLVAQIFWLVYSAIGGNMSATVCAFLQIISAIIGLFREWNEHKRKTSKVEC